MDMEKVRELANEDLAKEIDSEEKTLMDLRMGNAIGTTDNPLQIRFKRRDVARMKTVLRERALNIKTGTEG